MLVRLAIELLEKVDGRAQRPLTALRLRDSVIEAPYLVDNRLPLRAQLLARGLDAHVGHVDSQSDLMLLGERLGHAGVADKPESEGTLERRRLSRDWAIVWINAQASSFQRDPQLTERLRAQCRHGKNREAIRLRRFHLAEGFVALQLGDVNRSIIGLSRTYRISEPDHLTVQSGRGAYACKGEEPYLLMHKEPPLDRCEE